MENGRADWRARPFNAFIMFINEIYIKKSLTLQDRSEAISGKNVMSG